MDPIATAKIPISVNSEGSNPSNTTGANNSAPTGASNSASTGVTPTGTSNPASIGVTPTGANGSALTGMAPTGTNNSAPTGTAPTGAPQSEFNPDTPIGRASNANASTARTSFGNTNLNAGSSAGGNPYTWVRPEGRSNDHMHFNWPRRPRSNLFGQARTDPNETTEIRRMLDLLLEKTQSQEAAIQASIQTSIQAQLANIRATIERTTPPPLHRSTTFEQRTGAERTPIQGTRLRFSPVSGTPWTRGTPQNAGTANTSGQRPSTSEPSSSRQQRAPSPRASARNGEHLPPPPPGPFRTGERTHPGSSGATPQEPPRAEQYSGHTQTPPLSSPFEQPLPNDTYENGSPLRQTHDEHAFEQRAHTSQTYLGNDPAFRQFAERNEAELRRMKSLMHSAMSAAPDIDRVIEETRRTPFTDKIANARIRDTGKIRFPEYAGTTDPRAHVRAFRLAITKAHLSDYEKEPGYCRFFAENLTGPALEWFASLEGGSIDNFDQLISAFLKQYSVFIEVRATEADLWKLHQRSDEPLRHFIARFKEVKAKIANLNEGVAVDALKNGLWFTSQFKHELAVRPTSSLDDALHKATFFACAEEEYSSNVEKFNAGGFDQP